jgi:hypothetical protein
MKITLISTIILFLSIGVFTGCKPGCKDVHCQNDGECKSGGNCECPGRWGGTYCDTLCPIGFEGNYCNIPSRNKFVRTWDATTSSPSTGSVHLSLYVTNGPIVEQIIISNFNNENYTVVGTITNYNSFDIMNQNATGSYPGPVVGSGYLNGTNLAINLTKQGVDYFANCNR